MKKMKKESDSWILGVTIFFIFTTIFAYISEWRFVEIDSFVFIPFAYILPPLFCIYLTLQRKGFMDNMTKIKAFIFMKFATHLPFKILKKGLRFFSWNWLRQFVIVANNISGYILLMLQ